MKSAVQVSGQNLAVGIYQVSWLGLGPIAPVDILQKGKVVVHTQARIITSSQKASTSDVITRAKADGSISVSSIQFKGNTLELVFDE